MTFAVAGIQARMSSTRLPGKSLADVAGAPLVQRVVDRARAARRVDEVVVLTSTETSDDPLAEYCEEHGVPVRRGPLDDVYARYEALVREFSPRFLVRITGDCPLIDPAHIDHQLDALEEQDADFAPVPSAEHLFPGQGALSVRAFLAAGESEDPRDAEHVGSFFFARHAERFRFVPLPVPSGLSGSGAGLRLCVDEASDLEFVRCVFQHFAPEHASLVPLGEVIDWVAREPWPRSLNADVRESEDNQDLRAAMRTAWERTP